jgi:hypothetical protein
LKLGDIACTDHPGIDRCAGGERGPDTGLPASGAEVVELNENDLRMVAERFGAAAPRATLYRQDLDQAAVDLRVKADRNAWVRKRANPRIAVELSGSLHIVKPAGGERQLTGTLEPVRGRSYAEQFGRRFALEGGEVVFDGPPDRVRVDLQSQYTVPTKNTGKDRTKINMDVQAIRLLAQAHPQLGAGNGELRDRLVPRHREGEQ